MLFLGHKSHHIFDTSAVVPTSIEDDDFTGCRKLCDVSLNEHLPFLAIAGCWQRDHAKDARAHPFCKRLDGASFAGGIASLKYNDDFQALGFDPVLQAAKLHLELVHLFLVDFAFQSLFRLRHACHKVFAPECILSIEHYRPEISLHS